MIDKYGARIKVHSLDFMNANIIETIFLVGGLGSSIHLLKFLKSKLGGLSVKQPEAGCDP